MKTTQIINPDKTEKLCTCGNNRFYFSQGRKKRNIKERIIEGIKTKTWEARSYYILRCTKCDDRQEQTKQDWHTVAMSFI